VADIMTVNSDASALLGAELEALVRAVPGVTALYPPAPPAMPAVPIIPTVVATAVAVVTLATAPAPIEVVTTDEQTRVAVRIGVDDREPLTVTARNVYSVVDAYLSARSSGPTPVSITVSVASVG
jgi:hypothetical protein